MDEGPNSFETSIQFSSPVDDVAVQVRPADDHDDENTQRDQPHELHVHAVATSLNGGPEGQNGGRAFYEPVSGRHSTATDSNDYTGPDLIRNSTLNLSGLQSTHSTRNVEGPTGCDFAAELPEAHQLVNQVVHRHPNAIGIVLLVHNERVDASLKLPPLKGIHKGAEDLKKAFSNLGLAVLWLKDPSKKLLKAVIEVMSSPCAPKPSFQPPIQYPSTYKRFLFYTTGHGANRVFFTYDGSISYQDVVYSFSHKPSNFSTWHFFFDNCRSTRLDDMSLFPNGGAGIPKLPELNVISENCIVYATTCGDKAWGPGDGVSFMTLAMEKLLKKSLSMDELISQLQVEVPNVQSVTSHNAISKKVNLVKERDEAMRPQLKEHPTVFPDGAVVRISRMLPTPPIDSEFFQLRSQRFQMKTGDGNWIDLRPVQSNRAASPIPIPTEHCKSSKGSKPSSVPWSVPLHEASLFHDHGSSSVHVDAPLKPSSPIKHATESVRVALPVDRPAVDEEVEIKLLARYSGEVEVESNAISCRLPPLAKPEIESAVVTKPRCHRPEATVIWNVQKKPSIPIARFSVSVYREGSHKPPDTNYVDVEENQQHYQCSVRLTQHSDGDQYKVIVTADREDGEHVPSNPKSMKIEKGCLNKHCRYICALTWIAFFVVALTVIAILVTNSRNLNNHPFNVTLAPHSAPFEVSRSAHISPSFSTVLLTPDYSQQRVRRAPDREGKEPVDVYCADFEKQQLSNSQRPAYFGPRYTVRQTNRVHNLTLNNSTRCLPLPVFDEYLCSDPYASYMLPKSNFSVAACLESTSTIPSVELRLYRSVDANNRWAQDDEYILTRANLSFNESGCSNTTLAVPQSAIVFAALSSPDDVQFKSIYAFVTIVFYSLEALDLDKKSNLLESATGKSKLIPGSGDSKLVCYVAGELLENTVPNLISGLVPTTWVIWALTVGIIGILVLFFCCLVCVILCCVRVCVYVCNGITTLSSVFRPENSYDRL